MLREFGKVSELMRLPIEGTKLMMLEIVSKVPSFK